MDGTNMVSATPAPAPASFTPDQDDLDEMHLVRAAHDVLDLAHDLPPELRWGLLDYIAARLGGNGQPASEPRRTA